MKKILVACLLIMLVDLPSFAINWIEVKTSTGQELSLDKDSITEHLSYYFYNIKVKKKNGEVVVVTIQSQKAHPFCARIKFYTPEEYDRLNGDYENITSNITTKLEPVSFESRANAAYRKVRELSQKRPEIVFWLWKTRKK